MQRIEQSRRHASSKAVHVAVGWRILLYCGVLLHGPVLAEMPEIAFSAASVEYDDMRFEQVHTDLEADGSFRLAFERMTGTAESYLGDGLKLTGVLGPVTMQDGLLELTGSLEARGMTAHLSVKDHGGKQVLELKAAGQPLLQLAGWPGLPAETAWLSRGRFDLELIFSQSEGQPASLALKVDIGDLGFDSPEGTYAGEDLQLEIQGSWPSLGVADAAVRGVVSSGELLIEDFYRNFSDAALDFSAELHWASEVLDITRLSIGDDHALDVEARLQMEWAETGLDWGLEVSRLALDFPLAYQRYIEPLAAAWTLNGLEVTGRLLWSGDWSSGNLVSGNLEISDLSIVDTRRQRFAVTGLQARLRPGDHAFSSRLAWRGLLLGRINLGGGEAAIDSEPGIFALQQPLLLDVLGGQLELGTLKIILPGSRSDGDGEPDVLLRARMNDLDMGQLTAAFGWPSFSGTMSGEVPGVSLDDGVLGLDGEIRIDVFDGRIALNNLSLERAFGVLPGLAADLTVDNLDLEQLTQTFSFGRIAGRLDGQVSNLRMLDWKPVAFDAWLGTPEEQGGSNDISRQAVNRLTTLGGGSATTALTSPLMRMFSNFSYRRLGLGCRLQNNVCQLRGLSEDDVSVLLLEGAGVPKITIRAYNRNIDWPQMVSNLLAISADGEVRIGE